MTLIMKRTLTSITACLLFGLFPLVALWNGNLGQVRAAVMLKPFLFTLAFIGILYGIGLLIIRSPEKRTLLVVFTIVFAFSFGHIYNLVEGRKILGFSIGYVKLLIAVVVLFSLLVVLIIRAGNLPSTLQFFLSIMAAVLLILNLIPVIRYESGLKKEALSKPTKELYPEVATGDQPDIYYIVLDAYARQDVLTDLLGYDNTAFLEGLKERGFYLPECAFSNYPDTLMTISSVLNYAYLPEEDLEKVSENTDEALPAVVTSILENKAMEQFHQLGYQTVAGRGYSSFNDILTADIYLNYFKDTTGKDELAEKRFTRLYLDTTIARVITELYRSNPDRFSWLPYWIGLDRESDPYLEEASFWYYQNNYMFEQLEELAQEPGNFFVYAHINSPHPPYVYRSDGTFRYPLDTEDEKILYGDTLDYLNKRVLDLIDVLQENSGTQPVIILQADHAIHGLTSGLDKHKILSAYYLPGELSTSPYSTITPVNNFRLVLKNYFNDAIRLLPDTLFVRWQNSLEATPASCNPLPPQD